MDARSVLKEISEIAATPLDSGLRFQSRKLWPAFAKTLREVGPAAPVVAALVNGGGDSEATLSELYGGTAGNSTGPADRVYAGLGAVLTTSGRTIGGLAQNSPAPADTARAAIDDFLSKVPKQIYDEATAFRVARAGAA
ncbi:hypothetical protein FOA52_010526 [Chlamydomonas sp. UWO 241]|nr:hypothetical protein FOA52_010526 [Chlamydomonas sp. UWO 241]